MKKLMIIGGLIGVLIGIVFGLAQGVRWPATIRGGRGGRFTSGVVCRRVFLQH